MTAQHFRILRATVDAVASGCSLEQPLRRLLGDEREERTREMCVLSHTVPTALQEGG